MLLMLILQLTIFTHCEGPKYKNFQIYLMDNCFSVILWIIHV